MYVCFCDCHSVGLDKCPLCEQNHIKPEPPREISISYEGDAAQGINVRTDPVHDISVDDLQPQDVLLGQIKHT